MDLQDLTLTNEQRALINQEYVNKEDDLRKEKRKGWCLNQMDYRKFISSSTVF